MEVVRVIIRKISSYQLIILILMGISFQDGSTCLLTHNARGEDKDSNESEGHGIILNIPADAVVIAPSWKHGGNNISKEQAINNCTKEEVIEALNNYIDTFADTQVSSLFFNVNYQRACFDSSVMESYWNLEDPEKNITDWPRLHWAVHKKDVDPYDLCVKRCRSNRISPWISIRMNDHHYFNDPARINRMWLDHPEYRTRSPHGLFNYARKEVRDYYKAFIGEVLDRYDVDGIELDWMRTQLLFPDGKAAEGMELINQYMKEIRELAKEKSLKRGHAVKISVRVPSTPEIGLFYGLDAVKWAKEGLIDILVPSNWFTPTNFDISIELWKREIGSGSKCIIAAGSDMAFCIGRDKYLKQMQSNIETMRAFSVSAYSRGADSIYIFNNFLAPYKVKMINPDGTFYFTDDKHKALKEVGKLSTSLGKPRTHVLTYTDPDVKRTPPRPPVLSQGVAAEFDMYTGPRPATGNCIIHIGLESLEGFKNADLSVKINNVSCKQLEDLPRDPAYVYDNTKVWHVVKTVTETSARVIQFKADLNAVKDGYNRISVINNQKDEQCLTWLEVRMDLETGHKD